MSTREYWDKGGSGPYTLGGEESGGRVITSHRGKGESGKECGE